MSTTITHGATTVTPEQVTQWREEITTGNRVHTLLNQSIEITHRPASPRKFELRMLFLTESDAQECAALHRTAPFFDLVNDDFTSLPSRYAVDQDGNVTVELDERTRAGWWVTVQAIELAGA